MLATGSEIVSTVALNRSAPRRPQPETLSDMTDYITPRLARWREATDAPLLILAIGSLPLLLLELDRNDMTHSDRVFLDVVNVVVLVAFALDYLVELALASNRRS